MAVHIQVANGNLAARVPLRQGDTLWKLAGPLNEVCLFSDGLEALSWLRGDNRPAPRLMLLDIQLPKMDGYEVARMLRAKNLLEEMPLILMSSRDGVVDRLKGRLVGAQAYLTKPFTAQQLLEIVHWSLDKRIWI